MGIGVLLSQVLIIALFFTGCSGANTQMDSSTASESPSMAMAATVSSGKPTEFNAGGDIVRVEVYSADKQTLLNTAEDETALAWLNSEESTHSDTPWEQRPLMGREADAAAVQVSGTEEYVFSLYRGTGAGPEWLADVTTHTGSPMVRWYMSMGGIETYGLFDDPMVSYQNAAEVWVEYLRSLV